MKVTLCQNTTLAAQESAEVVLELFNKGTVQIAPESSVRP